MSLRAASTSCQSTRININTNAADDPATAQPVEPSTPAPENYTLEQALRENAKAWTEFPGDRIGSVLTDRAGQFKLRYDDVDYPAGVALFGGDSINLAGYVEYRDTEAVAVSHHRLWLGGVE